MIPTIQFLQDLKQNMREFTDEYGFSRWTVAKPLGITFLWRVKAAWRVLKGDACAVHWQ